MGRFALSQSDDWQLEHEDQDIRGWSVRDAAGNDLGTVTDLIAHTDSEHVESIVLDNGDEVRARDIELRDGVVYVAGSTEATGTVGEKSTGAEEEPVVKTYENARVARR